MTAPINLDLRNPAGVVHNENAVSLEARLPSPQRGRGATFSVLSRTQEIQKGQAARTQKLVASILVACLWIPMVTQDSLAQNQKAGKTKENTEAVKTGSAVAVGQRGSLQARGWVQKVFLIKHADVYKLAQVLKIFGEVSIDSDLKVIAVQVPSGVLPTVEDTIRRLDVPALPQNVELIVYLLLASDQSENTGSVPAELESVVKQLKTTFAFKEFRTVDTLILRSRDRQGANVSGNARLDPNIPPSGYSFGYRAASILPGEKGRSIRLDGLVLRGKIVVRRSLEGSSSALYDSLDTGLNTDVDVREGQKVVVGKAAVGGTNTALILVITAKVLE